MQSIDFRERHDLTVSVFIRRLRDRRVFVVREMRAVPVVVVGVGPKDAV